MANTRTSKDNVFSEKIGSSLTCIITGKLFEDPYQTDCNHIFEHSSLEQWLSKNHTCPTCRHLVVEIKPAPFLFKELLETYKAQLQNEENQTNAPLPETTQPVISIDVIFKEALKKFDFGQALLLLREHNELCNTITVDNLNAISPQSGKSLLYYLVQTNFGLNLLASNRKLIDMISGSALNAEVYRSEFDAGTTPVFLLASKQKGIELLASHPGLFAKISEKALISKPQSGFYRGTNALYWLERNEYGRLLLKNLLRSKEPEHNAISPPVETEENTRNTQQNAPPPSAPPLPFFLNNSGSTSNQNGSSFSFSTVMRNLFK